MCILQMILQGHVHEIQCLVVTPDKSCIFTCDVGYDVMLIQWDNKTRHVHIYPTF
jgi:hypothetical protein